MTLAARSEVPWLTVILPCHNGERWLARTLDSLAAQTCRDFDCILIDSSASLATIAIAERFQDRLSLHIEYRPDLQDWQAKTNLGVEMARSPHVGMLHQDDIWMPNRAARVRDWLAEGSPEVVMHLHPSWIIDEHDRRLGMWRCPLPAETGVPGAVLRERLLVQNFVSICAPVIRRDAFLAVGGLDRALWYTADWDLYLKLCRLGTAMYHRDCLAGYRIHAQALTVGGSRRAEDFEHQMREVLDRHVGEVDPARGRHVLARARASIAVNLALAGALHKQRGTLVSAAWTIVALGPIGGLAFLRYTRLIERVLPRLRLHWAGRLLPPAVERHA